MAVTSDDFSFSLQYTDEPSLFKLSNDTVYTDFSDTRAAKAEVLIAAHVTAPEGDTPGEEEFVTVDSTPVLSKVLYDINNTTDGHYRFEILRFPLWLIGNAYVKEIRDINDEITTYASLVYDTATEKFYQAIENQTGGAVTNPALFEEITDFTTDDIRNSDKIVIGEYNTVFDHRGRICVKDELYKLLCKGVCFDLPKMMPYFKKSIYLKGAKAKADDGQPEQAEVITRTLENSCGCD